MLNLIIAGIGGFIGTMGRYLISVFVYQSLNFPLFPYGTLIVNGIGCFLMGLLIGSAEYRQWLTPELRSLIQIGLLGGFTTYSAFGYETFSFLRNGKYFFAFADIFLQLSIGLFAVWLGFMLSTLIFE